ncbi:hypothetical protein [Nafulsella turpanensis]|uniref:hypothetical protein n=1 Tax=Nafulsella turpanensis TaxID=1265690 RepID=UPI00034A123C|nr:hypothetical protein [Nafulsella turpanensis]
MGINDIIKDYVEERLLEMEDETGINFQLCCQSSYGTLHACLSRIVCENEGLDDKEIESVVGKYFTIESCHFGEIYFNLLQVDWDKLQRKLKIQLILEE